MEPSILCSRRRQPFIRGVRSPGPLRPAELISWLNCVESASSPYPVPFSRMSRYSGCRHIPRKIDGSKLPFLNFAAKATDPTRRPLLQFLDNRIQSACLQVQTYGFENTGNDGSSLRSARCVLGLSGNTILCRFPEVTFADVVRSIRFRINHIIEKLIVS